MEPILPSVAMITHPNNRLMHQTVTLYVRTLDELCEQIAMIERRIAQHELN